MIFITLLSHFFLFVFFPPDLKGASEKSDLVSLNLRETLITVPVDVQKPHLTKQHLAESK